MRKYGFFEAYQDTGETNDFDVTAKERLADKKLGYIVKEEQKPYIPLVCISRDDFLRCLPEKAFTEEKAKDSAERLNSFLGKYKNLAQAGQMVASMLMPLGWFAPLAAVIIPTAFGVLSQAVQKLLETERPTVDDRQKAQSAKFDLIVVDSLNAYVSSIKDKYPDISSRNLLNSLCNALKENFGNEQNTVIIFTGEYHYPPHGINEAIRESFYCDVEIILRAEPVCVPENYGGSLQTSLGYNLNKISRDATVAESRSFCRVVKSRQSANQSRRCAYDIVLREGLKFYEAYPGDGKIILFRENMKQKQAWESFFTYDVPESYPALRCEVFDRISMQNVYEGQRRLRNVPLKTDMYLSSLDAPWVAWYRDFKLKIDIDRLFRDFVRMPKANKDKPNEDKKNEEKYYELVNEVVKIVKEERIIEYGNRLYARPLTLCRVGMLLKCPPEELKKAIEQIPSFYGEQSKDEIAKEVKDAIAELETYQKKYKLKKTGIIVRNSRNFLCLFREGNRRANLPEA